MNATIGYAAIIVAAIAAGVLTVSGAVAASGSRRMAGIARTSARVLLAGGGLAMVALVVALLTDDFSVRYVAEHHSRATPFPFDVATAWAALEGSIVLWVLVLAAFTAAVARTVGRDDRLGLAALAVLGAVALFFTVLVAWVANPFQPVTPVPADGPGPNPLLQNHILMAVHPPLLYIGYVGLSVPFAFGMGALALGDAGAAWLRRTRRWTLFAWTFLTAGIVLGALWSYEVLGWGGYWAWDPVENASFLPWLAGTAFLHSGIVQARRGVLKTWNIALLIATFALTILGTFLTRSGVVASVHSFTQSAVGPALLGFLLVVLVASLGLFAARAHLVAGSRRIDRLVSREGAFLVNNLLLSVFTFVVLLGTTYPIVLEALTGAQVSVGRPFFDRFAVPLALLLLAAVAVGPLLPYRAASPRLIRDRLRWPVLAGLTAGAGLVVAGVLRASVVVVIVLATTVAGAVAVDARRSTDDLPGGRLGAWWRLARRNRGWWGGQMAHLGVAVTAVAIAVTGALGSETSATLTVGSTAELGDYTLRYDGLVRREEPHRTVEAAQVAVLRDGVQITTLEPRLNLYRNSRQPIASPAVRTTLTEDLYLALRRLTPDELGIEAYRYPFMWLLWAGLALIVAGGGWALTGRRDRRLPRAAPVEAEVDEPRPGEVLVDG
jgi:cytochrome c-type biogenesis protein CcmF